MKYFSIFISLVCIVLSCTSSRLGNSKLNIPVQGITARGYEYTLFKKENGEVAKIGDELFFDYEVVLADSVQHDSRNQQRPSRYIMKEVDSLAQNVSPLLDIFPIMSKGDSVVLLTPIDSSLRKKIQPTDEEFFTYRVVLNELLRDDPQAKLREKEVAELVNLARTKFKNGDEVTEIDHEVKIYFHHKGTGDSLQVGDRVIAHYFGVLASDGSEFDNSLGRGRPFTFEAGKRQVIKGWDAAVLTMKKGDRASVYIPSSMGYGSRSTGSIPADSDLIFYIEILK